MLLGLHLFILLPTTMLLFLSMNMNFQWSLPLCLHQYKFLNEAFDGLPFEPQLLVQPFSPCACCAHHCFRHSHLLSSLSVTSTFPLCCFFCNNPCQENFTSLLKLVSNAAVIVYRFSVPSRHVCYLWAHKIMHTF